MPPRARSQSAQAQAAHAATLLWIRLRVGEFVGIGYLGASVGSVEIPVRSASGPLSAHAGNPRYFANGDGEAILLAGSHTWANLQERGLEGKTRDFDFRAYLDFLEQYGHNFIRLWVWEQATWAQFTHERIRFEPLPFVRAGPGAALDGKPRFDLTRFDDTYFERLRRRVDEAGERGFYASVMFFQGFSVERKAVPRSTSRAGDPWLGHPFHRENNINAIDGDPLREGHGRAVHSLAQPAITRLQEAYVRAVIDAVNDLDNVLFEVSNESHPDSKEWQYHMIESIRAYERTKTRQHPVGMTAFLPHGDGNDALRDSPADWISPEHTRDARYKWDPPSADGAKVVLVDTDHLWGVGGDEQWVWKSVFRGLNPIFMDPYKDVRWGDTLADPRWIAVRRAIGLARRILRDVDLARLEPRGELSSSGYCLAERGSVYLVYRPTGRGRWRRLAEKIGGSVRLRVDLSASERSFQVEWIDPHGGDVASGDPVSGGDVRSFRVPIDGDAILRLSAVDADAVRSS